MTEATPGSRRARFMAKVSPEPTSGCWLWTGSSSRNGYGQFNMGVAPTTAHRAAWILLKGPILAGLSVLHRCDNRACVNPDHLFVGTAQQNTDDMMVKGRNRSGHGSRMPQAKLSEAVVEEMRRMRRGGCSVKDIATQFGVHPSNASRIVRGLAWRHVRREFA